MSIGFVQPARPSKRGFLFVDGREVQTSATLLPWLKKLLGNHTPGARRDNSRLVLGGKARRALLSLLLRLHPEVSQDVEIVVGPHNFSSFVASASRCFHYKTEDGDFMPVSVGDLLFAARNGSKPVSSHSNRVRKAAREAIRDQMADFRARSGASSEEEVDHDYPFSRLLADFLRRERLVESEIPVVKSAEGPWNLTEPVLSSWRSYHKQLAVLKLLPASENAAKSNRQGSWSPCESI